MSFEYEDKGSSSRFGHEPLIRKILDPHHELAYWNQYAEGGHFPAMEVPDLVVRELRTFFAGLR